MGLRPSKGLEGQHLEHDRIFLLRCIEKYLHAANEHHLEGANELARLYFSPAKSAAAAEALIAELEARMKERLEKQSDGAVYNILHRYTNCARAAIADESDSLDTRFWHAIDDIAEADIMMACVIACAGQNPKDLIARVRKEYNRLAPLSRGASRPIHAERYSHGGVPR